MAKVLVLAETRVELSLAGSESLALLGPSNGVLLSLYELYR